MSKVSMEFLKRQLKQAQKENEELKRKIAETKSVKIDIINVLPEETPDVDFKDMLEKVIRERGWSDW